MLKQAVGGETIDEKWLQEYIDEGTVTYEYWKDKLGLRNRVIPCRSTRNSKILLQ